MTEIELLIDGLKKRVEDKKSELPTNATYAWGKLENIRKEIENYENIYNSRERNPAHRNEILVSFRRRALEIAEKINNITT